MVAYWYFVVYVSPVILVIACAYLAWAAYQEAQRQDSEVGRDEDRGREEAEGRPASDEWRTDPDSWKRDD